MTIEISPALVVSVLGLVLLQVGQIVVTARWSARVQTMVENDHVEIASLRQSRHEHANRIAGMTTEIAMMRETWGEEVHGRRGNDR